MDCQKSVEQTDLKIKEVPLILIVEDDEDNQLLLKYAITIFGWTSIIAGDAMTAIYLAKKKQPNLILLDIVLPYISGLHVATVLKRHNQTRHIPLIAVTGLAKEKEQNLIFAAGFNDYICKPYLLESLEQTISANLKITSIRK